MNSEGTGRLQNFGRVKSQPKPHRTIWPRLKWPRFELSRDGKIVDAKGLTYFQLNVFDFVMGRRVFQHPGALDAFLAMIMFWPMLQNVDMTFGSLDQSEATTDIKFSDLCIE